MRLPASLLPAAVLVSFMSGCSGEEGDASGGSGGVTGAGVVGTGGQSANGGTAWEFAEATNPGCWASYTDADGDQTVDPDSRVMVCDRDPPSGYECCVMPDFDCDDGNGERFYTMVDVEGDAIDSDCLDLDDRCPDRTESASGVHACSGAALTLAGEGCELVYCMGFPASLPFVIKNVGNAVFEGIVAIESEGADAGPSELVVGGPSSSIIYEAGNARIEIALVLSPGDVSPWITMHGRSVKLVAPQEALNCPSVVLTRTASSSLAAACE